MKTILLIRNEGTLGDMVVYSGLVKKLHEAGFTLDILLTNGSQVIMQHNPYVRNIYAAGDVSTEAYLKNFIHSVPAEIIKKLKENNYDLVIDPSLFDTPVHRMKLLRDINAKNVLGFNKKPQVKHYSDSVEFSGIEHHITTAVSVLANRLGIELTTTKSYDLHVPGEILDEAASFLQSLNKDKTVIINIFTGSKERCFSQSQLLSLVNKINQEFSSVAMILLDHRREINVTLPDNVVINPFKTVHHALSLISRVDLIISPDTSVVHMSAAWKKNLISVYKDIPDNNLLWGPGYSNASQIILNRRVLSEDENIPSLIVDEIKKRSLL